MRILNASRKEGFVMKIRGCRLDSDLDSLMLRCIAMDKEETISSFVRKAIREKILTLLPKLQGKKKGTKK